MTRRATCCCGQLRLTCEGEPVRVSMCHCLACQQRTGSTYGVQARFPDEQVTQVEGRVAQYKRVADSGNEVTFHFCPTCGSTVFWKLGALPGFTVVAVGAFADPKFPAPRVSVYEARRHAWVGMPADVEHMD
ncbi:MAG: GFA family protein [Myxococcota bacterium]